MQGKQTTTFNSLFLIHHSERNSAVADSGATAPVTNLTSYKYQIAANKTGVTNGFIGFELTKLPFTFEKLGVTCKKFALTWNKFESTCEKLGFTFKKMPSTCEKFELTWKKWQFTCEKLQSTLDKLVLTWDIMVLTSHIIGFNVSFSLMKKKQKIKTKRSAMDRLNGSGFGWAAHCFKRELILN